MAIPPCDEPLPPPPPPPFAIAAELMASAITAANVMIRINMGTLLQCPELPTDHFQGLGRCPSRVVKPHTSLVIFGYVECRDLTNKKAALQRPFHVHFICICLLKRPLASSASWPARVAAALHGRLKQSHCAVNQKGDPHDSEDPSDGECRSRQDLMQEVGTIRGRRRTLACGRGFHEIACMILHPRPACRIAMKN